ncbi:MAG: hypothetical protein ACOYLH_02710 [Flavobacteriales bacterium]|jgi:hypothetical protein
MKLIRFILPAMLLLTGLAADAQCRAFTKNKCLPLLEGYVQNENYNSAVLVPGDEAELLLTFYAGKEYRVVVNAHPVLGDVEFEIEDTNGQTLYSNAKAENKTIFDFKMSNTQQLIVKVRVPKQDATIQPEGCVTVLVGFKDGK